MINDSRRCQTGSIGKLPGMSAVKNLKSKLSHIVYLGHARAVLDWDQQTQMPPGAAEARAEQSAALEKVIHNLSTDRELGELIEQAGSELNGATIDNDDKAMLRVAKRNFDRAMKIPEALAVEEVRVTSLAHEVWVNARKNNDFKSFLPSLQKIVEIQQKKAECVGYEDHPYDALMDPFEPGMKSAEVDEIFGKLRPELVRLVREIKDSGVKVDDEIMKRSYPVETQKKVTDDLVRRIGYDFSHGRQDQAAHPFCTSFSSLDVRITTRFNEHHLPGSVFASMHETGHALYELGFPREWVGSVLAGGASLGFHESQSRMWENQVGRSREFIQYYFPTLQKAFPDALGDVNVEQFYRAANCVKPSLIRVEADEVTYALHIMLRYELEKGMIAGTVELAKLPEIWNAKMEEYLGIVPDSDANGVLQDVHWSAGILGYFPTYALGNLIAAQLWEKILVAIPDLYDQISRGEFTDLLNWLRKNVHAHGCKYFPGELIKKITGQPIDPMKHVAYLRKKFGEVYGLN